MLAAKLAQVISLKEAVLMFSKISFHRNRKSFISSKILAYKNSRYTNKSKRVEVGQNFALGYFECPPLQ
jgi:hypothetical protein